MPMIDPAGPDKGQPTLWRRVWEFPLVAMLVALGILAAAIILSGTLFGQLGKTLDLNSAVVIQGVAATLMVVLAMKYLVARLGRQPHDDFPLPPALLDWARGLAIGSGLMAVAVGIAALCGVYRITGWGSSADLTIILFSAGLVAGFVEESIFRGVLFRWIEEMLGSWGALAITSLLFGFAHWFNDNATVFSSLAIALEAGIMLGACYMLTRSLWLAVGLHMGWNITQGYIFDVPVSGHAVDGLVNAEITGPELLSGGAFGLEASVIGLGVATLAGLWLLRKAILAGQIRPPMWAKPAV
ncbi:MAG: lysostaphin resistance A-like protein [Novosphingobium sp.]